jgi:membrane protease YdiL (CAAX protease family)
MIYIIIKKGEDMEQRKDIIEFEDLFKEERHKRYEENDPHKKQNYLYAILVYFLIMQVAVVILYLVFMQIDQLKVTYTEDELVLHEVATNEHGLALMENEIYQLYQADFNDYIVSLGTYQGYDFIINKKNEVAHELFFLDEEATQWNEAYILSIFSSIDEVTWGEEGEPIYFIAGKNQTLPDYYLVEANLIKGPVTELTRFAFSFLNFSIYITLLPLLLIMLKSDLTSDWTEFKKIKPMWFQVIAIGYLYIVLGNLAASYLQTFLSDLLNIVPKQSVNQLSIENALSSSGAIFMILAAVLLGPIIEELIFRKAIFGLFKSDKVALAVSTFVFGAVHLLGENSIITGLINGIAYFVMGFIFGYIYLKNDKNIYVPIAVHILSNLISILLILTIY